MRSSRTRAARLWLPFLVMAGWSAWEAMAAGDRAPPRRYVVPVPVRPPAQHSLPAAPPAERPVAISRDPTLLEPSAGPAPEAPAPVDVAEQVPLWRPSYSAPAARSALPSSRLLRRDPVEPPLLERDAWRELVLAVTLNGERVSEGALFAKSPADGSLYVELAAAQAWRLRTDPLRVVTLQGQPYYPLTALTDAPVTIDHAGLTVAITVAATAFAPFDLGQPATVPPRPRAGTGGFIDYDLLLDAGQGIERRLDGLVELGAFAAAGVVSTGLRLSDLGEAAEIVRLDTTLARDLPERRSSFRLGDSLTTGGAFARSIRFAGLQYATNFATDPEFVSFPLPSIGGLAEQRSVVDVLVDNLQRSRGDVPSGPFSIGELPVVTGAGEVQLHITDLLGRERIVTQPYYVSARVLKAGLHDFAYEAGLEREGYGQSSFDYGEPLLSATHRYGFSNALTGEAHAEVEPDLAGAVVGGSAVLGNWGVGSLGLGASVADAAAGGMAELGYEYDGRTFDAGARTRMETAGFTQVGYDGGTRRVDQLSFGMNLGDAGQVGLLLLNRDDYDDGDFTSLAATWGVGVGPGALSLRARR